MESKDKRTGWIKDLKTGDKVIIHDNFKTSIKSIDKITPTGRITIRTTQYDHTGWEIGGSSWDRSYLSQWSQEQEDEIIVQINFQKMCNKLKEINWKECSYEFVEKMFLLLEENKEELLKNHIPLTR